MRAKEFAILESVDWIMEGSVLVTGWIINRNDSKERFYDSPFPSVESAKKFVHKYRGAILEIKPDPAQPNKEQDVPRRSENQR